MSEATRRTRRSSEAGASPSGRRKRPPNYLSRREQWRLLILVGLLMLVVILMVEAAKPQNWHWLWGGQPPGPGGEPLVEEEIARRPVDTRLRPAPADSQLAAAPDVFYSPADPPADDAAAIEGYFPGVQPRLLRNIQDDTIFRYAEQQAWFHLLAVLRQAPAEALEAASTGRVGFLQLYEQPAAYRGKLVTVRGTIRRAEYVDAPPNEQGFEGYWQLWLLPAGGPTSPIVIFALEMPADFPAGLDIREEAEITGFSYKRWAYAAQDTTRTAPVLLAKTVQWHPWVLTTSSPGELALMIVTAVLAAAVLGVGIAAFVYYRSRETSPLAARFSPAARAAAGLDASSAEATPEEIAAALRRLEGLPSSPDTAAADPPPDDAAPSQTGASPPDDAPPP